MSLTTARLALAAPLEDRWQKLLEDIGRSRSYPTTADPVRLGLAVSKLSEAYNAGGGALSSSPASWAARLGFSFTRDVPKAAAAVSELILTGLLGLPFGGRIDVLDIGGGLGATTWGVARSLAAAGFQGTVRSTLIEPDADALELASAIARAAVGEGDVKVELSPILGTLDRMGAPPRHKYDLVLLGQVLSEADVEDKEDARVEKHASLLRRLLADKVGRRGALVVIEPALRDRTRHLHRVRDALTASGAKIFAPCTIDSACPMLVRENDWCHEDLAIDLPPWLVPVARAAGLRHEGLTFSYLVVRPDGLGLREFMSRPEPLRAVASPAVTKGKRELWLCGKLASGPGHARLMRLDRHRDAATNGDVETVARGDLVVVDPVPKEGLSRLAPGDRLSLVDVVPRRLDE